LKQGGDIINQLLQNPFPSKDLCQKLLNISCPMFQARTALSWMPRIHTLQRKGLHSFFYHV